MHALQTQCPQRIMLVSASLKRHTGQGRSGHGDDFAAGCTRWTPRDELAAAFTVTDTAAAAFALRDGRLRRRRGVTDVRLRLS